MTAGWVRCRAGDVEVGDEILRHGDPVTVVDWKSAREGQGVTYVVETGGVFQEITFWLDEQVDARVPVP